MVSGEIRVCVERGRDMMFSCFRDFSENELGFRVRERASIVILYIAVRRKFLSRSE